MYVNYYKFNKYFNIIHIKNFRPAGIEPATL